MITTITENKYKYNKIMNKENKKLKTCLGKIT